MSPVTDVSNQPIKYVCQVSVNCYNAFCFYMEDEGGQKKASSLTKTCQQRIKMTVNKKVFVLYARFLNTIVLNAYH